MERLKPKAKHSEETKLIIHQSRKIPFYHLSIRWESSKRDKLIINKINFYVKVGCLERIQQGRKKRRKVSLQLLCRAKALIRHIHTRSKAGGSPSEKQNVWNVREKVSDSHLTTQSSDVLKHLSSRLTPIGKHSLTLNYPIRVPSHG